jgi:hypothetical protein
MDTVEQKQELADAIREKVKELNKILAEAHALNMIANIYSHGNGHLSPKQIHPDIIPEQVCVEIIREITEY